MSALPACPTIAKASGRVIPGRMIVTHAGLWLMGHVSGTMGQPVLSVVPPTGKPADTVTGLPKALTVTAFTAVSSPTMPTVGRPGPRMGLHAPSEVVTLGPESTGRSQKSTN